jgi:adenylate cyclase
MGRLFEEIKRRNVFRVAFTYIVAAWLAMQVVDVMFPALNVPDWVASAIAVLLIIGLPFALIFAWAFEITPEGLKREKDVDRSQSITHQTGRKLNHITIAILVVAVGFLLADKFMLRPGGAGSEPGDTIPSVAVLPFVNMSDDKENDYFSDGLSEELLNALAKVPQLHVAGRTSSFQFKGTNEDLRLIGQKLNVAHVLEGSVRKSGARLRITAQLIDAENGYHLWSNTYDRELTDIFTIQDEIASNVADALRVTLLGEAGDATRHGTHNVEAYNLYLQALYFNDRTSQENLDKAEESLQRAIELDPAYADAWALRAIVLQQLVSGMAGNGADDFVEGYGVVRGYADRALALDPDLPLANIAMGASATFLDRNFDEADRYLSRALEVAPNDVGAHAALASVRSFQGRGEEALELAENALRLDPLSISAHRDLGDILMQVGRFDDAIKSFSAALRLQPEAARLHGRIARVYLIRHEFDKAAAEITREPVDWEREQLAVMVNSRAANSPALQAAAQAYIDKWGEPNSYQHAEIYAYAGDADNAFRWLETAYEVHDPGVLWIRGIPLLQWLHGDPRWQALVDKLGV